MKKIIKNMYWEFFTSEMLFEYINAFLMRIPGKTGIKVRTFCLSRFFFEFGKRCFDFPVFKVYRFSQIKSRGQCGHFK